MRNIEARETEPSAASRCLYPVAIADLIASTNVLSMSPLPFLYHRVPCKSQLIPHSAPYNSEANLLSIRSQLQCTLGNDPTKLGIFKNESHVGVRALAAMYLSVDLWLAGLEIFRWVVKSQSGERALARHRIIGEIIAEIIVAIFRGSRVD